MNLTEKDKQILSCVAIKAVTEAFASAGEENGFDVDDIILGAKKLYIQHIKWLDELNNENPTTGAQ